VLEDPHHHHGGSNLSMLRIAPLQIDHGSGGTGIQDPSIEVERRGDGGEWLVEKRLQMVWGVNN
jgi:hypothetical protein